MGHYPKKAPYLYLINFICLLRYVVVSSQHTYNFYKIVEIDKIMEASIFGDICELLGVSIQLIIFSLLLKRISS